MLKSLHNNGDFVMRPDYELLVVNKGSRFYLVHTVNGEATQFQVTAELIGSATYALAAIPQGMIDEVRQNMRINLEGIGFLTLLWNDGLLLGNDVYDSAYLDGLSHSRVARRQAEMSARISTNDHD